jgi:DNA-binding beta-propeller fold protein YncE
MMRRLTLGACLLALAAISPPAQALGAANHPFLQAINGSPTTFEDACGVALSGGDVYVSDYYHDAIDVLNPLSTPTPFQIEAQIAGEDPGDGPCKIALNSASDLYVNNWHRDVVRYEPGGFSAGSGTVIDSATPTGLAVDETTDNVYVAHRTYVAEYGPAGNLITDKIGLGSLREAFGVAVSDFPTTKGFVYVPDAATHTVKVYDPATDLENPVEEWDGAATPQGSFTYLVDAEIAVDNSPGSPSYGHVFMLDSIGHGKSEHPEGALDEFNAAGDYRGQIVGFGDAEPSGVAIDPSSHRVYVTSGNVEGSSVSVYGPTALARTLSVVKSGSGGGSVISQPSGIACGLACVAEFNNEQQITLFANPDAHSVFTGWTVTGLGSPAPCPGTSTCTVLFTADREVKATFSEPTQETLTVSTTGSGAVSGAPGAISCPGVCSEHFNQGRLVTLTAHPAAHQKLIGWSGCLVQANPAECKVTMSEAKAVSATFAPIPQLALGVALGGSGRGTVTSFPPGISCPGTCSASFDEGSTVYLMAAPSPGSGFGGFGGACEGTATICPVAMGSARTIGAQFTGTASGQTAAASTTTVSLRTLRTNGPVAILGLTTSEAGSLLVSGPGLRPAARKLSAGPASVRLTLGRAARRSLLNRRHLRLRAGIWFLPADGGTPFSTSATLHFRSVAAKAAKRKLHR